MNKLKLFVSAIIISSATSHAYAGGLLTNTNQNIAFNRNFAREGAIGIDGVYANPAGVAFLSNGWHLSMNVQNIYQTRTIESGITVPKLQGTPFYQPFKLNGGNENGIKEFVGKASVPVLPSVQAALNYDHWGFQLGFAVHGGGGKASFNDGLGSLERQVSMIPALLYSQQMTSAPAAPAYSMNSFVNGHQYIFGLQFGSTYKFNEHWAVYGGLRFNYVWNKYEGNVRGISAVINGKNENLYSYFDTKVLGAEQQAALLRAQAEQVDDATKKAQLKGAADKYDAAATQLKDYRDNFKDKELYVTQHGWGITPIIGVDFKTGKWNFGARYEFTTHFNIENQIKKDDVKLFKKDGKTPNDLPGTLAVGTQYSILPNLRVMASYHYYFDKEAKMADDKQKLLGGNSMEFLGGAEWDITKDITVSAGGQRTQYSLGNGAYLSDMSFVTSSYSIGFGAKFKISKRASVNIAYFWTTYDKFDKSYTQEIRGMQVNNTDRFTRTNKALGAGVDIDF